MPQHPVAVVRVLQSKFLNKVGKLLKSEPEPEGVTCVLPWVGHCIQNPGTVTPCCRFHGTENSPMAHLTLGPYPGYKLSEYHHKYPQREFLAGNYPEHCVKCKVEDLKGVRSMRKEFNEIYEDVDTSKFGKQNARYIEISFGNLCNLACRMCNSNDSTRWAGVQKHLAHEITGYKERVWPEYRTEIDCIDIDLSEVDRIKFMGGEPMMHPDHELFLEKLVEDNPHSGRVYARYHTNATVRPNDRILEIWEQLGSVEIAFSIDGVGAVNDYIRPPSKWEQIEETVQWYQNLGMPNVQLHVHSAISVLNLFDLNNLWQWTKDNKIRIWNRDIVRYPSYLCVTNAPFDLKHQMKLYLQNTPIETSVLYDALEQIGDPDQWTKFINYTKSLDRYWGTSLQLADTTVWRYV